MEGLFAEDIVFGRSIRCHIPTLALYCTWAFVPEVSLGMVVKAAGMRRVSADSRSVWSSHWSSLASVWTS